MDLFLKNMQFFNSQDVTHCVLIVMFLLAVWTLILTAPIHCRWSIGYKWCNAKFPQISYDEEKLISWTSQFSAHFNLYVHF